MANYPATLDTTSELLNTATNTTATVNVHPAWHNYVSDTLIAIETELGTLPKGTYADVKARLADAAIKAPGADQVIQPTGDYVGVAVRANSAQNLANLIDARNSGGTILAYIDRLGKISGQSFLVNGTPLASTHLSDSSDLVRSGTASSPWVVGWALS